ncbi:hypothetical protein E3O10_00110 [Cryobacterium luteum]|uniref:Uncharacterized protein n=1 Tax=Cryobacterium luteum TaxID=1424661 RepID=A0A5F0DET4_9MICO|nr:hypothetical protein E3O10_00110 [Cryobacterium luteum]
MSAGGMSAGGMSAVGMSAVGMSAVGMSAVGIELLGRRIRNCPKRPNTGDAVAVSVGRDGASVLVPRDCGRPAGRGAERPSPRLPREQRLVEHSGRSRLDQVGALGQRLVHGSVHRPDRARDQPCDETRRTARATGSGIPRLDRRDP